MVKLTHTLLRARTHTHTHMQIYASRLCCQVVAAVTQLSVQVGFLLRDPYSLRILRTGWSINSHKQSSVFESVLS